MFIPLSFCRVSFPQSTSERSMCNCCTELGLAAHGQCALLDPPELSSPNCPRCTTTSCFKNFASSHQLCPVPILAFNARVLFLQDHFVAPIRQLSQTRSGTASSPRLARSSQCLLFELMAYFVITQLFNPVVHACTCQQFSGSRDDWTRIHVSRRANTWFCMKLKSMITTSLFHLFVAANTYP